MCPITEVTGVSGSDRFAQEVVPMLLSHTHVATSRRSKPPHQVSVAMHDVHSCQRSEPMPLPGATDEGFVLDPSPAAAVFVIRLASSRSRVIVEC